MTKRSILELTFWSQAPGRATRGTRVSPSGDRAPAGFATRALLLHVAVTAGLFGCAAESSSAGPGSKSIEQVVCEDVDEHLQSCVGYGVECEADPPSMEVAEAVLATSCEALQARLEEAPEEDGREPEVTPEEEVAQTTYDVYFVKVGCAGVNARGVRVERVAGRSNSTVTTLESLVEETTAVCISELRRNGVVGPTASWVISKKKVRVEVAG